MFSHEFSTYTAIFNPKTINFYISCTEILFQPNYLQMVSSAYAPNRLSASATAAYAIISDPFLSASLAI